MFLSAFCGTVIFIVLWSLGSHSLGIFTAKQPMRWPQEVEAKPAASEVKTIIVHSKQKIVHLANRHMTANVGQYGTAAAAQAELVRLRKYLNDCAISEDYCADLASKVYVRDIEWVPGEGKYTWFLAIEPLDDLLSMRSAITCGMASINGQGKHTIDASIGINGTIHKGISMKQNNLGWDDDWTGKPITVFLFAIVMCVAAGLCVGFYVKNNNLPATELR